MSKTSDEQEPGPAGRNRHPWLRLWPLLLIALVAVLCAGVNDRHWRAEIANARQNYVEQSHNRSLAVAESVERQFRIARFMARTVAQMPGIQRLDPGQDADPATQALAQDLFDSLSALSAVRQLSVHVAPSSEDSRWHEMLWLRQSGDPGPRLRPPNVQAKDTLDLAQAEADSAYAEFWARVPRLGLAATPATEYPSIVLDRSAVTSDYLIQLAPLYRARSQLGGLVSVWLQREALEKLLPAEGFRLIGPQGQLGQDSGPRDPGVATIYAETLPLAIDDAHGRWGLEVRRADSEFWSRDDVRLANAVRQGGYGVIALGALLAVIMLAAVRHRRLRLERDNALLMQRVRERTSELEKARDVAESATRAKSSFLASMSHEIRTPLNGVIGMLELLGMSQMPREQREQVDIAQRSARDLLTILNEILDFSKIEAGKLELDPIEFDLRSAVEDVATTMAFQAASKDIELIVDVAPALPERVIADPSRVKQILFNLLGNAIKFTREGEIELRLTADSADELSITCCLEVRDSGIGMSPEAISRLFQPFSQAERSTKRSFGGTGLGLSIVKRLVDMMHGQIEVESEPGRGSLFRVRINFALPADGPARSRPSVPAGTPARVLVVDDNATNRRVLREQLAYGGYRVTDANDARQALSLLEEAASADPYDIVVTDFAMPGLDGADLGMAIRAAPAIADVRMVLLTSLDSNSDTARFAALGFAAYLTKPVRGRELLECLRNVLALDGATWRSGQTRMVTRGVLHGREVLSRFSGKVLVVEDNPVNQRVASRVLERLGCTVQVAADGQLGVDAWAKGHFQLVLMDMQMPVMDGLHATREIRDRERLGDLQHTPIVGLTASVVADQIEDCLLAGMDETLPKPIDLDQLADLLERLGLMLPESPAPADVQTPLLDSPVPLADEPVPLDLARLEDIADGDQNFVAELAGAFLDSATLSWSELQSAAEADDAAAFGRAVHKFKGACGSLGADALRELCAALEAEAGAPATAWSRWSAAVNSEIERARRFLQAHLAQSAPSSSLDEPTGG